MPITAKAASNFKSDASWTFEGSKRKEKRFAPRKQQTLSIHGPSAIIILETKEISDLFAEAIDPFQLLPFLTPWFIKFEEKREILKLTENATSSLLMCIMEAYKNRQDISLQDLIDALKETKNYFLEEIKEAEKYHELIFSLEKAQSKSQAVSRKDDFVLKLKKYYIDEFASFKPLWSDERMFNLEKIWIDLQLENTSDFEPTKEILGCMEYFTISFRKEKVVICKGEPGSGKSTISKYLCYKWAKGEWNDCPFYLVFLAQLNKFVGCKRQKTIIDVAVTIAKKYDGLSNQLDCLKEMLECSSYNTLVILDGYDETIGVCDQLKSILHNETMRLPFHILLTSRPQALAENMCPADVVNICPLNYDRQIQYVRNHFGAIGKPHLGDRLITEATNSAEITKLPKTVQQLCQHCFNYESSTAGKPSKPVGPLGVHDVLENEMTLDWKPPVYIGSAPIDHYEIEKLDTSTRLWNECGRTKDSRFTAKGLQKGKHYKFRIKAINSEGDSDPLENDQAILAKNPYDKPGQPQLKDWDIYHVDIAWFPPPIDADAPIEKYQIEKRTKYGQWEPAIEVPGDKTEAMVPNLTEGEEYEFRIFAINKSGPSDPSDASRPVIAKARNLSPNIRPIKLHAGQPIHLGVAVEREPPPKVTKAKHHERRPPIYTYQSKGAQGKDAHSEPTKLPEEPVCKNHSSQEQFETFAAEHQDVGPQFASFRERLDKDGILNYGIWKKKFEKDYEYDVFSKPKGRLLVICNKNFKNPKNDLEGYEKDATLLERWFDLCDFKTQVEFNLDSKGMIEVVEKFSKEANHRDTTTAFVVILSHGLEDKQKNHIIAGVDASTIRDKDGDPQPNVGYVKLDDLIRPVTQCDTLKDKPKVFVVQACRGGLHNIGQVQVNFTNRITDQTAAASGEEVRPQGGDVLRAYATIPGHVSWVNKAQGSWFIQALLGVFTFLAAEKDVLSMLTIVSNEVSKRNRVRDKVLKCKDSSGENMDVTFTEKQQTSTRTELRKDLFLYPGLFKH